MVRRAPASHHTPHEIRKAAQHGAARLIAVEHVDTAELADFNIHHNRRSALCDEPLQMLDQPLVRVQKRLRIYNLTDPPVNDCAGKEIR